MAFSSDQNPGNPAPSEDRSEEAPTGQTPPAAPYTFRTADGQLMPVPPEGTLGLLAAGYRGIMLWREARAASGWTPAKAANDSKAAFRAYKQAAKPDTAAKPDAAASQEPNDSAASPAEGAV